MPSALDGTLPDVLQSAWPEGELSVQVAVDSLVELLKERIDRIIALSRKEDWRKRKEIADIAFSYFLLMKIHHWQISHRK